MDRRPSNRLRHARASVFRCAGREECRSSDTPFDRFERDAMAVIRQACGGMSARRQSGQGDVYGAALRLFPWDRQQMLACALIALVQTVALGRSARFAYSNPACPDCALVLTGTERHLLSLLHHVRRGATGRATAHAAMLCDRCPAQMLLAAAQLVADYAPPPAV